MTTDPADGAARRGITRTQATLGTVAVIVGGCVLVVVLGMVFATAGGSRDDDTHATYPFAEAGSGAGGLDVESGSFVVEDGVLRAVDASPSTPAVALADRHAEDGRLVATAVTPTAGWGLVVRWEGPDDHWRVGVPEGGGPLEVVRVDDGTPTVVATAAAAVPAGAVVDVRFDSRRIDVRVDDVLVATVRDESVTGRQVGVRAGAPTATWDDVETGPRPRPVVRPGG